MEGKDPEVHGEGNVVAKPAPNFKLKDHQGNAFDLATELLEGPILLSFYPGGPLPLVCQKQFCEYRDRLEEFGRYRVRIVGISPDPASRQMAFAQKNGLSFRFLVDPDNRIAQLYGCRNAIMFGGQGRAVFVINSKGLVLYRYIEPTVLTRRRSPELLGILADLSANSLI